MQIALLPTLSDSDKLALKRWLTETLANARLVNMRNNFPLYNIAIYLDGEPRISYYGAWQNDGVRIRIGQESAVFGLGERLGVLAALISVGGLWAELNEAYSTAVSKALLESYNTAMQGLVRLQGGGPATGLAFSADRMQVAAMIGEVWHLPNGEAAEVTEEWTVVN